ncbi:MAG: 3-phosphoshikimate 1-carboxyvinyltransferase [Faecalimonas sp.]|nr:3-phosphoshikimate 1-carboxyvinyltransferase [Faecalimonas sp.]
MRAIITPSQAKGHVLAPPSKSMAHRMLMGAGLSEGTSVIRNIELSEDIKATLGILKALGCSYEMQEKAVTIRGIGGRDIFSDLPLDCKESGSTLRFFIPLLLVSGKKARFTGASRLLERPLGIYEEICEEQGISFSKGENTLVVEGRLQATKYQVKGNISSQFITGLLFALPLLLGDSVLEVLPPVESKAYIEMSLEALAFYGIQIRREENTYYIAGGQRYQARDAAVEGDYSNAAFLEALNCLGGEVVVEGLREDSLQGDRVYREHLLTLEQTHPHICLSECPDLGPILMGMAAAKNGAVFTGTERLKIKESDRGAVMAEELKKFGISVDVRDNEIVVYRGRLQAPTELLDGHNDHRIVMTLATLCSVTGGTIVGCEAVKKSFPSYFDVIKELGIDVKLEDESRRTEK